MARETKTLSAASSSCLAVQLRLFAFIQLAAGAAFIATAFILLFPPWGSGLVVSMLGIGILAIVAALMGFIAASPARIACCLSPYITLVGLTVVAQAALLLYLFIAPGKAEDAVIASWTAQSPEGAVPPEDKVHGAIYTGRWVMLGLVGAQLGAVLTALLLRCCAGRKKGGYDRYEDEQGAYQARAREAEARAAKLSAAVAAGAVDLPGLKNKGLALGDVEMGLAEASSDGGGTIGTYRPPGSAASSAPSATASARPPFKPSWAQKASGSK